MKVEAALSTSWNTIQSPRAQRPAVKLPFAMAKKALAIYCLDSPLRYWLISKLVKTARASKQR